MLEESPNLDRLRNDFPAHDGEAAGPKTDDGLDTPIDLGAAALAIWIERKKVLRAGLAALILASVVAFLLPATYTGVASFVPPEQTPTASSTLASSLGALGASSLLGPVKSTGALYVGILKSRSIADAMTDRFKLMTVYNYKKKSLAEKNLEKHSTFETDTKSSIITISVTDKSPERARDMANGYLDELRSVSGRLALTENSQKRLFYEQQLTKEKDALADAEVALKQSQEKTGLIAPTGQAYTHIQAIAEMRAQLTSREVQLSTLQQAATNENPEVIRLQGEIGSLRLQIEQMERGGRKDQSSGISTSQVPGLELDYVRKERDVKYHEALFGIIAKQYEAARMDEAHAPPLLQIVDTAVLPDTKSGPHRILIIVGGFLLGIFVMSVFVLFQAAKRHLLSDF